MKLSGFNKMLAVGLILLFVLPATSVPGGSPGAGSAQREGRAAPDHNAQTVFTDFSGMQMSGVTQRPSGGLALQMRSGAWQPEFVAVSHTKDNYVVSIATDSNNDYIVVYVEKRNGVDTDIFAQWFDDRGNTKGDEIAVCTAPENQTAPAVAVNSIDQFAVCWADGRNGGTYRWDIFCQFFDASGNKAGQDIQVSTGQNASTSISISSGRSDNFMMAWMDTRNFNATNTDIYGQILDANGTLSGGNFAVSRASGIQQAPRVAPALDGGFLAAWQDMNAPFQIFAQRMDAAGGKVGGAIAVTSGAGTKQSVALAAIPLGGYMVAWDLDTGGASGIDVFTQKLDENGTVVGTPVTVSSADSTQEIPSLVVNSFSYSLVVWIDHRSDMGDIYGQWLDPNGTKFGSEVKVVAAANAQFYPIVAVDGKDDMVVAWQDYRSGMKWETYARQLIFPYFASGNLTTDVISPSNLWAWNNVTAEVTIDDSAASTISFEFSSDNGSSWQAMPLNGSLAGAGGAPGLRIRADLATSDNLSSPVLYSITVNYLVNRPPTISLPASVQGVAGTAVNITANGADPDGDPLTIRWTQLSGPALSINGTTGATITLTPAQQGQYSLSATANDGFNNSAPATVDLTVAATPVPTLTVTAPTQGQLVNTTTLVVSFTVTDWTITQTGGHIHYQLDAAGEVMWFSTAPFNLTGLTEGNHMLKVYLASANHTRLPNPESYVIVNFTVGNLPSMPDLSISGTDIKLSPSSPRDGDTVAISATVHTTGTADAGVFGVRFFLDGTALPDQNVVFLAKGGSTVVEANWKAKSGSHNISVQVNPGGGLAESSSSNNDAGVKLSVAKPGSGGASGGAPMLLIGIVVLIMIVVVIVLAVMMMRRKPATVVRYQPPAQAAGAPPSGPNAAPAAPQPPAQAPQQPVQAPPVGPSQTPPGPPTGPA